MKRNKKSRLNAVTLMPRARRMLHTGLCLILLSLLRLLYEVHTAAPFTPGAAAYYGGLLEYPLAALALLTGATLMVDRAMRSEE